MQGRERLLKIHKQKEEKIYIRNYTIPVANTVGSLVGLGLLVLRVFTGRCNIEGVAPPF